jgi:citrate lyase gamma subunit/flagellar basal body-associated protein FliL
MDKNYLQDVVPPAQKKSIRNIPLPNKDGSPRPAVRDTRGIRPPSAPERPVSQPPVSPPPPPPKEPKHFKEDFSEKPKKKKGSKKLAISGIVLLLVIIAVVAVLNSFSGAKINIYPKESSATVDATLSAVNLENRENALDLGYKIVEVSAQSQTEVTATGEEEVQTKASGTIKIFNDYTESTQPLVKNTRFETPDGLIYRIDQSITVPGKSGNTPGTVEAVVYADDVGEEYNQGMTTFTIPGFEGKPQFDGFRAESVTEMTGGFDGVRKIVSEDDLNSATESLREDLRSQLRADVTSQVNNDFIVVIDDSLISFKIEENSESASDKVNVILRGSVKAIVMNAEEFSNHLAQNSLTTFNASDVVSVNDPDALSIVLADVNPADLSTLSINVTGGAKFIWQTDTEQLSSAIAGKNKRELKNELEEFPSIKRAEAVLRPFWKSSFPEDIDKIEIVEIME